MGKRYDGNENPAFVDIGMVGSWESGITASMLKPLLERYTTAQLDRYVTMHLRLSQYAKIMLMSGGQVW